MSDPKRATVITVGATKSAKNNVNKTVRLTINLDESNESKYPELNYKELVIAEDKKKRVENGKRDTSGLDPFSETNDDVARIAKQFEQKYGGKSRYGRKGRSKHDDFADIGAGYDENDSFIDNTDGYDEMIPPECDTLYGGFYINCGSLEFKNVPENQTAGSDGEIGHRRNKRRISSSSSESESSESSSESESAEEKDKVVANGDIAEHNTEHRKKKIKKIDKKKAKKVRRTDSSAATSGKQTSDDNAHGDGESADSRTSQSDSLTSKPAPSSENAITSDSSRDTEMKTDVKLPPQVTQAIESLESCVSKYLSEHPNATSKELIACADDSIASLERALASGGAEARRGAAARAARSLRLPRAKLLPLLGARKQPSTTIAQTSTATSTTPTTTSTSAPTTVVANKKRKVDDDLEDFDPATLTPEQREALITETIQRLKALIDERKPGMISSYNAECERVQEERKKIQIASASEGAPHVEKRMPKRRFPWCARSRALLARCARLAPGPDAAARLLHARVLPLFPQGFVRMPTLLRQADLNKDIKAADLKRPRLGSSSQPAQQPATTQAQPALPQVPTTPPIPFSESIHIPSSLTITTTNVKTSPDKVEVSTGIEDKPYKSNSVFGSIINSFTLSKELTIEKDVKNDKKDDHYIPHNNIGSSITITPVPNNVTTKPTQKINNNIQDKQSGFIRVKSPAALNEMVKKDKVKKPDKDKIKDKRIASPLHVDTSYQPNKKDPSPKQKEEIPQKQIENMRVAEDNIPRPALVPVHHSPTFAKPDKRPPEVKKKKDVVIISDVDPLSDQQEPLAVDDSSSDVELVEDFNKSELKRDKNETVPSKDRVIDVNKKVNSVKCRKEDRKCDNEEASKDDFDAVMRNIREMEHSQETPKFNSSSKAFGGVISNAMRERCGGPYPKGGVFDRDKDKLTERTSLNKMDGCNGISG